MNKEQSPNSSNISNEGEGLAYLIGLPISEVYLHGVIAGKEKLIKDLQDQSTASNKRIVELIEEKAANFENKVIKLRNAIHPYDQGRLSGFEAANLALTDLLTAIKEFK